MRGVVLTGNRAAEIREFPAPQVGPGEAVVQRRASGLCGTDLHRYRAAGPTAMITGHEPCGVIVAPGPGSPDGLALGERVMVHHYRGGSVTERLLDMPIPAPRCMQDVHRGEVAPWVVWGEREGHSQAGRYTQAGP